MFLPYIEGVLLQIMLVLTSTCGFLKNVEPAYGSYDIAKGSVFQRCCMGNDTLLKKNTREEHTVREEICPGALLVFTIESQVTGKPY